MMKSSVVLLFSLLYFIINLNDRVDGLTAHEASQVEEFERKVPINKYNLNDDSFEEQGEEENGDDSVEYSQLGPSDLSAYLYGRSLKKGFNAWAGKRELKRYAKRLMNYPLKNLLKMRQRRRPWGGAA